MSSLAKQLTSLRLSRPGLKVTAHRTQPSILFDSNTARNTNPTIIYSLAVGAFSRLESHFSAVGHQIMSEDQLNINRNLLSQEQNAQLSRTLIRFMIETSPFFALEDGQLIVEYLLRNFNVHIFETQALAVIFLPYWNHEIYARMLANVDPKTMENQLSYLKDLAFPKESINIRFVAKTLSYNPRVVRLLLGAANQLIRHSSLDTDQIINAETQQPQKKKSAPVIIERFLLQVLCEFLKLSQVGLIKSVVEFVNNLLRLEDISGETFGLTSALIARLMAQNKLEPQQCQRLIEKLARKAKDLRNLETVTRLSFAWLQRSSVGFKHSDKFIAILNSSQEILKIVSAICQQQMSFMIVTKLVAFEPFPSNLASTIGLSFKKDQFFRINNKYFLEEIFTIYSELSGDKKEVSYFLRQTMGYELATYINASGLGGSKPAEQLYGQKAIKNGDDGKMQVDLGSVKKCSYKPPIVPEPSTEEMELEASDSQEEQQPQTSTVKTSSVLKLLCNRGIKEAIEISNLKDLLPYEVPAHAVVAEGLLQLVAEYYDCNETAVISQLQKNTILGLQFVNLSEVYNSSRGRFDLMRGDYQKPLALLLATSDPAFSEQVLMMVPKDLSLLDNTLFRELCRVASNSINVLAGQGMKQKVWHFFGSFYGQLYTTVKGNPSVELLCRVNNLMLRTTQSLFAVCPSAAQNGKLHKTLSCHCKVMSLLIEHHFTTGQTLPPQEYLENCYQRLVDTFGVELWYLINLALTELLGKNSQDPRLLTFLVDTLISGTIHRSSMASFMSHSWMICRTVALNFHFLGQISTATPSSLPPLTKQYRDIFNAFPIKQIIKMYKLTSAKAKQLFVKRLWKFLNVSFSSVKHSFDLISQLSAMASQDSSLLLRNYSLIFKLLTHLQASDIRLMNAKRQVLTKMTAMFPLELRIQIFTPLLPSDQLYSYLASQLAVHSVDKSNFQSLQNLVNIVPTKLSFEWASFTLECLRRKRVPLETTVNDIFTLAKDCNDDQAISAVQIASSISAHNAMMLVPHVQTIGVLLERVCGTKNQFAIAALYRLFKNMGEFLDPLLQELLTKIFSFDHPFAEQLVIGLTKFLQRPALIRLVVNLHKTAKNLSLFSRFLVEVCKTGVSDEILQTYLAFCRRLVTAIGEESIDLTLGTQLIQNTCEGIVHMAMKMNQDQLRKVVIDLTRWAGRKSALDDLCFNPLKLIVSEAFGQLANTLGQLFNNFFSYVLTSYLTDFQAITDAYSQKIDKESTRRPHATEDFKKAVCASYIKSALKSLQNLCANDTEREFVDSAKFDQLADPICNLIELVGLDQYYAEMVESSLHPFVIALCEGSKDDFHVKSLAYKILLRLRNRSTDVQASIFELMAKLAHAMNDRFLALAGDIAPYLLEFTPSRAPRVKAAVKEVIKLVEEISGEKFESYAV